MFKVRKTITIFLFLSIMICHGKAGAYQLAAAFGADKEPAQELSDEDKAIIENLEFLENMEVLGEDMVFLQELETYEEEYVEYLGDEKQ